MHDNRIRDDLSVVSAGPLWLKRATALSHLEILLVIVVTFAIIFLFISVIASVLLAEVDFVVLATFALNLLLGVLFLVLESLYRPFSIMQVHWVFFITFFVVAPLSQVLHDYSVWGYKLTEMDYVTTNIFVMLWALAFAIGSWMRRSRKDSQGTVSDCLYKGLPTVSRASQLVLITLSALATIIIVRVVGIENLFSRATYGTGMEQTESLLFDKVVRVAPVFCCLLIYVGFKQRSKTSFGLVAAGILVLLSNFPAGMSRYNAAAIYGGLLLTFSRRLRRTKGLFPLFFLLAVLVIFPASNVYRVNEFDIGLLWKSLGRTFEKLPSGFCAGDYDAYSMLARSVHYVNNNGMTLGRQLLTVVLFFVPRTVWPSKAQGTGAMLAMTQNQSFTNISAPLPAEGYANFGLAGLLFFGILAGIICRILDRWYYEGDGSLRLFYPFACMLFFFVMRGDLLSGWAYTVGYATTFCLVLQVSNVVSKYVSIPMGVTSDSGGS